MVGVRPVRPGDHAAVVERGVVRRVDIFAGIVRGRAALRKDDREGVTRSERNRVVQLDGVVAGIGQRAGLRGHQRAGGRIAGCRVLVDLDRIGKRLVPVAQRDCFQKLAAFCGEDVCNLGVVCKADAVADAIGDDVAGAVILIVMIVVVNGLRIIEVDVPFENGGVLVGDPHITLVEIARAPAVLTEPCAAAAGLVRLEVARGNAVVPANDRDRVVCPLMGAAVLRSVVDRAGIGVGAAALIVADVARAVFHDGTLDAFDVRAGNPFGVLHVRDVVVIRIRARKARACDRACFGVRQRGLGFVRSAAPTLQSVSRHFAVAAGIEAGVGSGQGAFVAGQHALRIVCGGVVEIAVLRFGKVQARRCGGVGGADFDAVLDHVALDRRHCRVRPAGAVRVLVLNGGDVVVVAAVV